MSNPLPPHPSLENLKKQAKTLHKAHRAGDLDAAGRIKTHLPRLADVSPEEILQSEFSLQEAQLVIAREYGFPSWPRLVEALPQYAETPAEQELQPDTPADALPSSLAFTDHVKDVLALAREAQRRLGHNYIGTEHLLLGIIEDGEGKAVEMLTRIGLDLHTLKQSIEDYVPTSGGTLTIGAVPFTPRAKQILEIAANEARERGDEQVEVEHLLLALAKDREGVAAQVLAAFGADYRALRAALDGNPLPRQPRKKRVPRVTRPPSANWMEWRDEMHRLSAADLDRLREALAQFFAVTESMGFVPVLFPENRTLSDLVEHELKQRRSLKDTLRERVEELRQRRPRTEGEDSP